MVSANLVVGQTPDSISHLEALIFSESAGPVEFAYIINLRTGRGSISDSSGHFSLWVLDTDSLLFRHISHNELVTNAGLLKSGDTIHLKINHYELKEVKVFVWGSSYADFSKKFLSLPSQEKLGEKLGLPQQKGDPIPDFRNKDVLRNPFFALTNPIDFLYYNLNKNQQSIRKVMELKKDEDLVKKFESVYNRERVASITKLSGPELDNFMIYLNIHFRCDFNCDDIQIINEIFLHWKTYKSMIIND